MLDGAAELRSVDDEGGAVEPVSSSGELCSE